MKLLNINEDCPIEFFIFVNTLNPVTEHNLELTGCFSSAAFASISISPEFLQKYQSGKIRYLPYEPCEMDQLAISQYYLSAINDYRIEYDAEICRENNYSLYPSRLSALYAFGDFDSCQKVSKKYGWDIRSVRRFWLKENQLNRVVRVNMEIVSLARHAYRISSISTTEIDSLWSSYWSGIGNISMRLPTPGFTRKTYDSDVIWEYLIEGSVQLFK